MSSEWQSYQLGDLFDLTNGFAFKGSEFKPSGIPVIKIKNVKPNCLLLGDLAYVDIAVADKRPDKELKRGDILITMSGNRMDGSRDTWVGKVAYFDIPGRFMLNQRVGVLRPKKGIEVDRKCCAYFLSSDEFQDFFIAVATSSGGQANLSPSQILGEKIRLPPLIEQKKIASLLSALDDRITLLRETNSTLEAIAQALFKSWFVDFDPVHAKMQGRAPEGMDEATAALFPDSFEDSDLGPVPKGWAMTSFRDSINVIGGGTPKTSVPEFWGGDIPWFSVVDAPNASDVFVVDTEKHITEAGLNGSSTKLLPAGTTIISARGTVGRLALTGCPMAMNQSCYGLRGKAGDQYFTYFSTTRLVEQLKQRAHGSVFDTITQETFAGVSLGYPTNEVIQAFEQLVEPLLMRIRENLIQANSLASLRDALLPRLISGQLLLTIAVEQVNV
jgi:type I restriction enzyme S subunit